MQPKIVKVVKVKLQTRQRLVNKQASKFDSFGSYTGVDSFDKFEKPIQDADDL